MEDLKKAYNTIEEYRNELVCVIRAAENHIEKSFKDFFSEEEHKIINEARELVRAPYHYSVNKDAYIMGREAEAIDREREIAAIIKKANELTSKFSDEMPPNMKATYQTSKLYHKNLMNRLIMKH